MSTHTATERLQSISTPDRLLRFDAMTDARYEREHGAARVAALRHLILMGLLFFNISIFTSAILTPDIFWLSFVLRTGIITPGSLVLAWAIGRMGGVGRERLVTGGLTAVIAAIAFLFRSSQAPQAGYMIGELPLFLVFGNMLLVLRFRHALVYTASTFVFVVAAIVTKPGLDQGLQGALLIQLTTGCLFSLYANHRSESARCRAYLDEVRARLETEAAEAASSRFLDLSMTDALTGLPNRRALDRTVGQWSAARRDFGIVMIDIDHFKAFNDRLGHPAGDACLREVAAALSRMRPAGDHLLARFGGEEFTLLVAGLSPLPAARLGADLVAAVTRLAIPHPGRADGSCVVTISAGIALTGDAGGSDRAFEAADEALYDAKRDGRNRCHLAEPLAIDARVGIPA